MPAADNDAAAAYRDAWSAWQKQLDHLHRVLLEGEPVRPDQMKGLLNREERTHERYEDARKKLLGIDDAAASVAPGENPFR